MINCVYFDLDECLIFSSISTDGIEGNKFFEIDLGDEVYYTIVRERAQNVIDAARTLVGNDNVYILTSSMRDYALSVNSLAGFGFPESHVIAREDYCTPVITGWGGASFPVHERHSKNNVLIDNLPHRYNEAKVHHIGDIPPENYLRIRDYYGVTFCDEDEPFEELVVDFLNERHGN